MNYEAEKAPIAVCNEQPESNEKYVTEKVTEAEDESFNDATDKIPQLDGNIIVNYRNVAGALQLDKRAATAQHVPYCYHPNCEICQINPASDSVNLTYVCNECNFFSKTASGLIKHKKKKHLARK